MLAKKSKWDLGSFPRVTLSHPPPTHAKKKGSSSFISAGESVKKQHVQCGGGFAKGVIGEIQHRWGTINASVVRTR